MKAIIIAAGRGSRLGEETKNTPKPLVKVNNISFFENTINCFKSSGIQEISAVIGYKKDLFASISGLNYFENDEWERNNILHSLFCAKDFNKCFFDVGATSRII